MDNQPVVTRVIEDTLVDHSNQFVPAIQLLFKVGDFGPFSIKLPKEGFTAAKAQEAMRGLATEIGLLKRPG